MRAIGTNVKLQAKNGVPSRVYSFRQMQYLGNKNDYTGSSIRGCAQNGAGWKPVCDHRNYCKTDSKSIYIGQSHHLVNRMADIYNGDPDVIAKPLDEWQDLALSGAVERGQRLIH